MAKNKNGNKDKKQPTFYVHFLKKKEKLVLKIIVPIDYKNLHKTKRNNYSLCFNSNQKKTNLSFQILLNGLNECIEFLFNEFHKNVYLNSGILYVLLEDISEITENKTPYNKMERQIIITKKFKSEYGKFDLSLRINKEIAMTSIIELFNYKIPSQTKQQQLINLPPTRKQHVNNNIPIEESKSPTTTINEIPIKYVKAIVLQYNRKCAKEEHYVIDVKIGIKIVSSNGDISTVKINGGYCKKCNQYIILKKDFDFVKQKGVLLCQIEDKTIQHTSKIKKSSSGNESKIHMLGYNVIKKYDYTYKQREVILANIIENYNITKHQILSIIDMNIARHKKQTNYADAVNKWIQDREYILKYESGDCPEVIVSKVVVGKKNS